MPPGRRHREPQSEINARLLAEILKDRARLVAYARRHSKDAQDAEDALGDACLQFLRHFDGEDPNHAARWMLTVLKRCSWAIPRRRRERRAVVEEVSAEQLEDDQGVGLLDRRRGPEEMAEAHEEVGRISMALARLTRDQRRALLLSAAGYTFHEIASIEGWTYTKVNRSIFEGRRRLRRIVGERGED